MGQLVSVGSTGAASEYEGHARIRGLILANRDDVIC